MIALLLCGLIAGACAAPQFDFGARRRPFFSMRQRPYTDGSLFDTGNFWADLSKELKDLDDMLVDFTRHLPNSPSQEGVVGNEYKLTISLPEFEENDIVVKARDRLLLIEASHKYTGGSERNYLDMRTLPANVNVTGNWIFEEGVLKITFPLKDGNETPEVISTSTPTAWFDVGTTTRPEFAGSREEIEPNGNEGTEDVDVGLRRGDEDKDNDVETNEIPHKTTVEATTYAVDLKDVEFVPIRY